MVWAFQIGRASPGIVAHSLSSIFKSKAATSGITFQRVPCYNGYIIPPTVTIFEVDKFAGSCLSCRSHRTQPQSALSGYCSQQYYMGIGWGSWTRHCPQDTYDLLMGALVLARGHFRKSRKSWLLLGLPGIADRLGRLSRTSIPLRHLRKNIRTCI